MNCMSKASESLSLNKSCSQAGLTLEQLAGATPRMYWAHCGNVGSMRQSGEKGVIGVEAAVDAATAAASTTPKNMRLRCKASLVVVTLEAVPLCSKEGRWSLSTELF